MEEAIKKDNYISLCHTLVDGFLKSWSAGKSFLHAPFRPPAQAHLYLWNATRAICRDVPVKRGKVMASLIMHKKHLGNGRGKNNGPTVIFREVCEEAVVLPPPFHGG